MKLFWIHFFSFCKKKKICKRKKVFSHIFLKLNWKYNFFFKKYEEYMETKVYFERLLLQKKTSNFCSKWVSKQKNILFAFFHFLKSKIFSKNNFFPFSFKIKGLFWFFWKAKNGVKIALFFFWKDFWTSEVFYLQIHLIFMFFKRISQFFWRRSKTHINRISCST